MYRRLRKRAWCLLGLLGLAVFGAGLSPAEVIEEIIVQVNDRIIVLSEYQRSLQALRQELAQEHSGLELEGRYQERAADVLRDLIDQQLLVQKAEDLGLSADTEVVRRLDEIRQQMQLPSMEALEQAVAQQGMNYEDFRQNLRNNLLTQQVISREVGSRLPISPDQIRDYYASHKEEFERPEGVRIQQVLISTENKPEEELPALQEKADEVVQKARAGENFADLARQFSDDPTAARGGDAGFFERGTMAPEIESVVYALERDRVSDPIRTRYGFLIVKLLERTSAGIPPLAEVENRVHERLYFEKVQPALREYLTRLRGESYIMIKPGYVDSGEPPQQASTQQP